MGEEEEGLAALVRTCCDEPQQAGARVALKQLHRQCRASKDLAASVAAVGGVAAAHRMLSVADSQEALGLLWSISAIPGTLEHFTPETLATIVHVGRVSTARDGWRQTAALSTLHNLLCYSGYAQVLDAGGLTLAGEVLEADKRLPPSAQASAALFLDQCCFNGRSKLPAVQTLRLPVLVRILERQPGAGGEDDSSRGAGGEDVLLGHVLSLLWNASDDVFFSDAGAWADFTTRLCQHSVVRALQGILVHGAPMQQQGAGAILHNLSSNRALHPTLLSCGVLRAVLSVAQQGGEGAICSMLAAAELAGSDDDGASAAALVQCEVVQCLVRDLHLRSLLAVDRRDSQYVGTRKLLSALESLAASSAHMKTIRQSDAVEVLLRVVKGRHADGRGMALALRTLLHIVLDAAVPKIAFSPPLLAEVARNPTS